MANYSFSNSGNFTPNSGSAAYRLDVSVNVTDVSGGWLLDVTSSVTMFRNPGSPAFASNGTRSWSIPGARTTSTSGGSNTSGSASWSYDFRSSTTVAVYNFSRYVAYSHGGSTTVSISAAGNGSSSFLTSRTVSVPVTLTAPPVQLGAPTNPSVSVANTGTANTTGFTVNWSAVSGVSTYGVWWNSSFSAPSAGASPDFSGITGTSRFDQQAEGTTRYYWVSSQTVGTPSAWVFAGSGTVPASTVTVTFNYNGNGSSDTTAQVTPGATFALPSAPSRSGYNFTGWNDVGGNSYGTTGTSSRNAQTSPFTLFAQWSLIAITPSFTDSSVSSPATMGTSYSDGVVATNASSYSIISGALPTGLSFNTSSGTITGTPTVQGSFTFSIRATSSTSNTADTGSLTINVLPPGTRPSTSTRLNTAKRFDGSAWVNLTTMKRFDGTSWVNITNT